jgi:tetratricopeptide (TPR) repeat protein
MLADDGPRDTWLKSAASCAAASRRRGSREAALSAAHFYMRGERPEQGREVLVPFEPGNDVRVLYYFAWFDSRLGKRELALEEYRRAYQLSEHLADGDLRATTATLFGYELYRDSQNEEAVRVLNKVLQRYAGSLATQSEREARLNLARSLQELGDAPAAEAEFQRLRGLIGSAPLSSLELLLDARLHAESGQPQSAVEILVQAQAAARRESNRLREAFVVMRELEIAVTQTDWERVRTLLAEVRTFADVLRIDDQRQLTFDEAVAARVEGRLEASRTLLEQTQQMSPPPNERWQIAFELGRTLRALGQRDAARDAFRGSISEIELQRQQLVEPTFLEAQRGSREKPYDALFEMYAEANDGESALSTLRKALASRLDDQVAIAASGAAPEPEDALERASASRRLAQLTRALPARAASTGDAAARFIAFVTTESNVWALVHAAGRSLAFKVEFAPEKLCLSMQKFGEDFDDEVARRLGRALFPPETLARLGPRFAVILPRCAHAFPVAALRVGTGRLVDRAVVSIAPDVSTVSQPEEGLGARAHERALVMADPLLDLPFARVEARWTGQVTGAEVRLGATATADALEPSGGRLLHFATHSVVDVSGPALELAGSKLSVAEILGRRLHAHLVVLASCHSGSRLEATASETLSTAFLRAGSGAVLATLRSVEDQFASQVVRAFYEAGGLDDPAGALTRVQRQLARSEAPSRWSAFFVAGSPAALPRRLSALHRAQASGG